jgi:hypothetical protein
MSQQQRDVSQLSETELREIVEQIRSALWFDWAKEEFDPDKEWDWDTIEFIAGVLDDFGLQPERKDAE